MTNVPRKRKTRRRRRRTILAAILLVPVLVVAWSAMTASPPHNASGYPETFQELDGWLQDDVPPEENAAPIYSKAFSLFEGSSSGWAKKECESALNNNQALPEEPRTIMVEYLQANEPAIRILYEATEYSRCHFSVSTAELGLPHLASLDKALDLLQWRCIFSVLDGDVDEAVRATLATLATAQSVKNEPFLWSQHFRTRAIHSTVDSLELVLSRLQLTDDALVALQSAWMDLDCPECMTRAYAGERCLKLVQGYDTKQRTRSIDQKLYRWSGIANHDRSVYDRSMLRLIEISKMPFPEALTQMDILVKDVTETLGYWKTPQAMHLLPPFADSIKHEAKLIAKIRMSQAALAIERYRLLNGTLPDSLSALVPGFLSEVPENPFDGNDVAYDVTENGYILNCADANDPFTVQRPS